MVNEKYRKNVIYPIVASFASVALMVFLLNQQGRVWWCKLGDYVPWSFDIWSGHNSQHLFDPYTFTHILHGVIYFWIINLIFRDMPLRWKFFIVILVECGWELLENSNFIIGRYREATISLDYFGDSILNSLSDVVSCAFGAFVSYRLKFWKSFAYLALTEILLLFIIRDNLTINIIMLIYPIEAIKRWQMGS